MSAIEAAVGKREDGFLPGPATNAADAFPSKHLENRLARALIAGDVKDHTTLTFRVKNDALELR